MNDEMGIEYTIKRLEESLEKMHDRYDDTGHKPTVAYCFNCNKITVGLVWQGFIADKIM